MSVLSFYKRAKFDYQILKTYTSGLILTSDLVKSIREGRVILDRNYIVWQKNNFEIINLKANSLEYTVPVLLKKSEISEIKKSLKVKGLTLVVISLKTIGRWIKADIALVRGKKKYDKKEYLKNRDIDRENNRNSKYS